MGLFKFLTKQTKQMEDDVFGLITFRPYKSLDYDYFVGNIYFAPLQKDVDFIIHAAYTGPKESQRQFYQNLENNYQELTTKSIPLLHEAFRKNGHEVEIKNFNIEFELQIITLPDLKEKPVKWNLGFSTIHDDKHQYTIEFSDETPTTIFVDELNS